MSETVVIPSGGGEVVGDTPDRRVEILSDHEALHATWSRSAPGREGAPLHVHRYHMDLFYVLDGELTVMLGSDGDAVAVPTGTLARLPPLVVHGFRNGSDADVRYLNFHAPGLAFADYLRALRDGRPFSYDQHPPPRDGARPPTDSVFGGDGFVADRPGLAMALLADVEEIGIAEIWSDAGRGSPPAHVHRRHVESLYVLEGELSLMTAGRDVRGEAGSWMQVPPGVPHTWELGESGGARFLEIHTPSCGFGAFVRALREVGGDAELAAARASFDQVPA